MPSHLTRHVFRRLLANQPIGHRECLRRRGFVISACGGGRETKTACQVAATALPPRRTFFDLNMFGRPKRELKDPDMAAGMDKMRGLEKLQRMKARLPPQDEMVKAMQSFLTVKMQTMRPLDDIEASLLLRSIKYSKQSIPDDGKFLNQVLALANRTPANAAASHVDLAFELREMCKDSPLPKVIFVAHKAYCIALVASGKPGDARNAQLEFEKSAAATYLPNTETGDLGAEDGDGGSAVGHESSKHERPLRDKNAQVWAMIIKSYAQLGQELEIQRSLEMAEQRGLVDISTRIPKEMLLLTLDQNVLNETQSWWRRLRSTASISDFDRGFATNVLFASTYGSILKRLLIWCAKHGHIDFGQDVVRGIMQDNPLKTIWDVIFVWAAATGKGVDEIGRMIEVMESTNDSRSDRSHWRQADTATINALVEYAISKEDPYMAERFIALGRERGIDPDAKTYMLQIDYRLRFGDTDGALTAYKNLQSTDVSSEEDVLTVNKLITALCSSKRYDFDTIMNVAADLSDRRARFEPQTVSTLALLHLNRDEVHDVTDLLNTHGYHFSSTQRAAIQDTLLAYCLDPQTPLARTWDAYTILRESFDELQREPRTNIMSLFFRRERPDIAVHIFNHMRAHSREDTIPTIDTYVTAFMGAARLRDIESLELIHNQLKLDVTINVNTRLRNALLIAYTACSKPRKALGFWDDIVASREGPSYNSIHVAFRACEHAYLGDLKAKEIWERLRKMNVELDCTLWGSYVAAVAGQGDIRHAVQILASADEKGELDVDEHVLGSLFMGTPSPVKQKDVEVWARDKYPQVWARLAERGIEELENGSRVLKGLDRSVAP